MLHGFVFAHSAKMSILGLLTITCYCAVDSGITTKRLCPQGDSGGAVVWRGPSGEALQMSLCSRFHTRTFRKQGNTKLFSLSGPFIPYYLDWIANVTGIKIED